MLESAFCASPTRLDHVDAVVEPGDRRELRVETDRKAAADAETGISLRLLPAAELPLQIVNCERMLISD